MQQHTAAVTGRLKAAGRAEQVLLSTYWVTERAEFRCGHSGPSGELVSSGKSHSCSINEQKTEAHGQISENLTFSKYKENQRKLLHP